MKQPKWYSWGVLALLVLSLFTILNQRNSINVLAAKLKQEIDVSEFEEFKIFISVCDGESKAKVFHQTGIDYNNVVAGLRNEIEDYCLNNEYKPIWYKIDIVTNEWQMPYNDLHSYLYKTTTNHYRYGFAVDDYRVALLEQECNANGIYNYETDMIDVDKLSLYLGESVELNPEDVLTLFTCKSVFMDSDKKIYSLSSNRDSYGRRYVDATEKVILQTYYYDCVKQLQKFVNTDTGMAVYGYYLNTGDVVPRYNMLRHLGTLWSLIEAYSEYQSLDLKEVINSMLPYVIDNIQYNDGLAFIYEPDSNEYKVGGSGLALIALSRYTEVFNDASYVEVIEKLADGVLSLQSNRGGYYHVLDSDFNRVDRFRTVYYDGEATLGLFNAYRITKEQKYLDGALKAVDMFIDEDYTEYHDHWVSYSMNNAVGLVNNLSYFEFAFLNAYKNVDGTNSLVELPPTRFELFMQTHEAGLKASKVYLEPDEKKANVVYQCISDSFERLMNSYAFPEVAMYMARPNDFVNLFYVRSDSYRARIDDVQHSLLGLQAYIKNIKSIQSCYNKYDVEIK